MNPRKEGLPAVSTATRAQKGDSYFLLGGVERLTYDLRSGREISPDALVQAEALIQRVDALKDALHMRISMLTIDEEDTV